MNLVEQSHWDNSYSKIKYAVANDRVTQWLDTVISPSIHEDMKTAFEFGCFPCRYLAHIGLRGYEINGCDITPRTEVDLINWLKTLNIKIGRIERTSASEISTQKLYSLVYSVGFIEHYDNYERIILDHLRLVENNGSIIITCPNFAGNIQHWLHKHLDKENLKLHNTLAMNPDEWKKIVEANGFKVVFSGYFGGFDFWTDNKGKTSLIKKIISGIFKIIGKLSSKIPNSKLYSPYVGLVALKCTNVKHETE